MVRQILKTPWGEPPSASDVFNERPDSEALNLLQGDLFRFLEYIKSVKSSGVVTKTWNGKTETRPASDVTFKWMDYTNDY